MRGYSFCDEEKRIWRWRAEDRKTHIPALTNDLAKHHLAVMAAISEVPVILNKLKALHKLDYDEANDKVERRKTVVKNAYIRHDAKKQIAANQKALNERRERALLEDDVVEPQDNAVDLGAPDGREDMADAAQDAGADELEQILENQPDWRSSLNAAVHWYNHHPQVHQDDIFERDQIIAVLTQKAEREAAQGPGG